MEGLEDSTKCTYDVQLSDLGKLNATPCLKLRWLFIRYICMFIQSGLHLQDHTEIVEHANKAL